MIDIKNKAARTHLARLMTLGLLVTSASCDTEVINPGPTDSRLINDGASTEALVNGAGRSLADALNWIAYTSAAIAREVHPSGSTGSFGITPEQQRGELTDLDSRCSQSLSHHQLVPPKNAEMAGFIEATQAGHRSAGKPRAH